MRNVGIYIVKKFDSVEEFRNSPHNFELKSGEYSTIEGKEAKRFRIKLDEKGNKIQRYDKALYINTIQDDGSSTDNETIIAAEASAKTDYKLTLKDCSDVVSDALVKSKDRSGRQILTGENSYNREPGQINIQLPFQVLYEEYKEEQPIEKFKTIKKRNSTAIPIDNEIKPD